MTTLERIRAEMDERWHEAIKDDIRFAEGLEVASMIINKYASEECDRDCEHCAYIECPKEPCEDAVSRQAVKDLYCRICMETNICYRSKENCEDLKLFDELPSVQPKAKTGRWITEEPTVVKPYVCSECGHFYNLDVRNYCPNCGADMRGTK